MDILNKFVERCGLTVRRIRRSDTVLVKWKMENRRTKVGIQAKIGSHLPTEAAIHRWFFVEKLGHCVNSQWSVDTLYLFEHICLHGERSIWCMCCDLVFRRKSVANNCIHHLVRPVTGTYKWNSRRKWFVRFHNILLYNCVRTAKSGRMDKNEEERACVCTVCCIRHTNCSETKATAKQKMPFLSVKFVSVVCWKSAREKNTSNEQTAEMKI